MKCVLVIVPDFHITVQKDQGLLAHVFKQNVEFCPATYRLVEIMQEGISDGKWELK